MKEIILEHYSENKVVFYAEEDFRERVNLPKTKIVFRVTSTVMWQKLDF